MVGNFFDIIGREPTMTFFIQPWHFTGKKRHGWKFENNRIFTFHTSTMTFLKKKRHAKVPYFIFSPEKYTFVTILLKIEWVSKNTVFYFFPRAKKKKIQTFETSERVSFNFSRKKNTTKIKYRFGEKKIQQQMRLRKYIWDAF